MKKTVTQLKNFLKVEYLEPDGVYYISLHPNATPPRDKTEVVLSKSEFKQLVKDCCVFVLQEEIK